MVLWEGVGGVVLKAGSLRPERPSMGAGLSTRARAEKRSRNGRATRNKMPRRRDRENGGGQFGGHGERGAASFWSTAQGSTGPSLAAQARPARAPAERPREGTTSGRR